MAYSSATFDLHPTEDKIKICNDTPIGVEDCGSLTVAFPSKEGGVTIMPKKVAYVPDLAFNHFSLMAALKRGVCFVTCAEDLSVTLPDGRLRPWSDGDLDTQTVW